MDPKRQEIYNSIEIEYVASGVQMDGAIGQLTLQNTVAPFVLNLEDEISNLRLAWQTSTPQAIKDALVRIGAHTTRALETVAPFGRGVQSQGQSNR